MGSLACFKKFYTSSLGAFAGKWIDLTVGMVWQCRSSDPSERKEVKRRTLMKTRKMKMMRPFLWENKILQYLENQINQGTWAQSRNILSCGWHAKHMLNKKSKSRWISPMTRAVHGQGQVWKNGRSGVYWYDWYLLLNTYIRHSLRFSAFFKYCSSKTLLVFFCFHHFLGVISMIPLGVAPSL